MLSADRRGYQAAWEQQKAVAGLPAFTEEQLLEEARSVLASLRVQGYAHLDPEHEFIRGYVLGFHQACLQKGCSHEHIIIYP